MARLLFFWWVPLAVAFAAVVAWETDWLQALQRPLANPVAPTPKAVTLALLPEYKPAAGPDAYAEVVDRPLFSPSRRQAPPPPPPEQPKQQMQTGLFQLTGTIQVGDKLYAFLKETKSGKGVRAAQGDSLSSGAKLAKVEHDRVVLTQYDGEEEVKLQVAKSTRPTPTQPAPGQPGQPGAQPQGGQPPGTPGVPQQPFAVTRPNPDQPSSDQAGGRAPGTATAPGSPTFAPFVPGVGAPATNGANDVPPRRRGAMQ